MTDEKPAAARPRLLETKSLTTAILTTIVTFFVMLVLNFVTDWATEDNGVVRIPPPFATSQRRNVTIDIVNFTRKVQDGLIFSVPSSINLAEADSFPPVQIERVPDSLGTNQALRIRLSGLQPLATTRLLLPYPPGMANAATISLVNASEKRFRVESPTDTPNPNLAILKSAATSAVITAVLYLLFALWLRDQQNRVAALVAQLRLEAEAASQRTKESVTEVMRVQDNMATRINEAHNNHLRVKIVLLARLSDAAKELTFWRDTIRRLLFSKADGFAVPDKLIEEITSELKTHSTRESEPDFDAIKTYAGLLQRHREPTGPPKNGAREEPT
jgi:TolB-like protein